MSDPQAPNSTAPARPGRAIAALVVAVASDALSLVFELVPPLQWALDGATALLLFALLGFRKAFLPVLVIEAVPGLAAFPTWTVAVLTLATFRRARAPVTDRSGA